MKKRDRPRAPSFATLFKQLRSYIPPHSIKEGVILGVVACLLLVAVFAVVFPFYAAWTIFDTTAFLSRATATAQGSVANSTQHIFVSSGPGQTTSVSCDNTITFQAADGRSITFVDKGSSCNIATATVLYDPSHPSDARASGSVHASLIGAYIIDGIYLFLLLTIAYSGIKGWWSKRKTSPRAPSSP